MQPKLTFREAPPGLILNQLFPELPKEQQVDFLGEQVLQLQQLVAMQHIQLTAWIDMQKNVEAQSGRLQAIALETNHLANARSDTAEQALAAKTQECLAQDAEIAALKALLASEKSAHAASQEAAQQALATQAKAMEAVKEKNAILEKAFRTTEKTVRESSELSSNRITFHRVKLGYTQYYFHITTPNYLNLVAQVAETREQLQQSLQNQTKEA